jgi:hypothetical protein
MSRNSDLKLLNSKIARLPHSVKGDAEDLSKIFLSSTSNGHAKRNALTDLDAIFVKHGVGSFFNRNGHRVGGRRTKRSKHTLRKKRANRKTRRHSRRA